MTRKHRRIPFIDGDEQDALTPSRQFYNWKKGQLKKVKRAYNKRMRKYLKPKGGDDVG